MRSRLTMVQDLEFRVKGHRILIYAITRPKVIWSSEFGSQEVTYTGYLDLNRS